MSEAPRGMQLDLLRAIKRMEQAGDPGESDALRELLVHRLAHCDARRLRRYLTDETLAWESEQGYEEAGVLG